MLTLEFWHTRKKGKLSIGIPNLLWYYYILTKTSGTTQHLNIKKSLLLERLLFAVWTGLEPATFAVTGRHSNQLNYQTVALLRLQIYTAFFITQMFLAKFLHKLHSKQIFAFLQYRLLVFY